jgi:hypothetical protein
MKLNDYHKKFLQDLGRNDTGRTFVEILEEAKRYYSSIDTIDTSRPTDSQIEGRKLFGEFIDIMISAIKTQKHNPRPITQDDFTS